MGFGGEFAEVVFDVFVEDAGVVAGVESVLAEAGSCFFPAGPDIAAEGGEVGWAEVAGFGEVLLDDGVDEDEAGEEGGVHEREVDHVVAAEGVANAEDGGGHGVAEDVGQVEEVAGVVKPRRWIAVLVKVP